MHKPWPSVLPHPKGVSTDWQVCYYTHKRTWGTADRFRYSYIKIQAGLSKIGFLTNHPLRRIFVPGMKCTPPPKIIFLQLCAWHCSPWSTSCWHHLEGKRSTPPSLQPVSHLRKLHLFPYTRNGSLASSQLKCRINHDYNLKGFPSMTCIEWLQSWV